MKNFIAVLAALFISGISGWVGTVEATSVVVKEHARGNRFVTVPETEHPTEELAKLIEISLAKDPRGTFPIDVKQCYSVPAHCGTPLNILESIQKLDPEAGILLVGELPSFIRSLVLLQGEAVPKGNYWTWCLVKDPTSGSGWKPVPHCASGPLDAAWMDPKTKKVLFKRKCTNPIDGPDLSGPCAKIFVHTKKGQQNVRFEQGGPTDRSSDECMKLKRSQDEDFTGLFIERCAVDKDCDFAAANQYQHITGWKTGSYDVEDDGATTVQVPMDFAEVGSGYQMIFCLTDEHGNHSCGSAVTWHDYVMTNGEWIANIYIDEKDSQEHHAATRDGKPSDLWWHKCDPLYK